MDPAHSRFTNRCFLLSPCWRWCVVGMMVLGLSGCSGRPHAEVLLKFQAAQSAFNSAASESDYLRAANLLQEVLDGGFVSGAVFYNQGNAYIRAGQRGRAIAAYRQALRYRPRDPKLRANLAFALGDATPPQKPIMEYLFFWQAWWGYDTKFRLAFWVGTMTLGLGVAAMWVHHRAVRTSVWIMLFATAMLSASAAYDWQRFELTQRGVVIAPQVTAKKGDAESYEEAFTQPLLEGTEFTVIRQRDDWILLRLSGAQEGWVPAHTVVVY